MSVRVERYNNGRYKIIKTNLKQQQYLKDYHWYLKEYKKDIKKLTSYGLVFRPLIPLYTLIDVYRGYNLYIPMYALRSGKKATNQRLIQSKMRTMKKIKEILFNNLDDYTFMVSLTFKENIKDYKKAYAIFNNYIKPYNLKYLCVKELQNKTRGGVIHYHLMLFDVHFKIKEIFSKWFNEIGGVHIQKIKDKNVLRLANYYVGYMFKDGKNQLIHSGFRIFTTSKNLKKNEKVGYMFYLFLIDLAKYQNNLYQLEKDLNYDIVDYALWIVNGDKKKLVIEE